MARRCWKHSRQKTGRPCVGRKGTVVSLPHCEQLVLVSARTGEEDPPTDSARLALQDLQRLGSFLNPLSAKNICSPAVKTNSAPQSEHFRTLSWYSMEAFPLDPQWWERADWATKGREKLQKPKRFRTRFFKRVRRQSQAGCRELSATNSVQRTLLRELSSFVRRALELELGNRPRP